MKINKKIRDFALLAVIVATTFFGHSAFAHSTVIIKSDPAAGAILAESPSQVMIWFTDELQIGKSTIQVFDASEKQVDPGNGGVDLNDPDHAILTASLPDGLGQGLYQVKWKVGLVDGDGTNGEFYYFVGDEATGKSVLAGLMVSASPAEAETSSGDPAAGDYGMLWMLAGVGGLFVVGILLYLGMRGKQGEA